MKFLLLSLFVIFLSLLLIFTFLYNANATSPKFPLQTFNDKNQDVIFYSRNDSYGDKSTENEIRTLLNIKTSAISSNGTHLEIKFFFEDSLNNLTNILTDIGNSDDLHKEFFINILIDSDDDENTGFLGYDHRYTIRNTNNNSSILQGLFSSSSNNDITINEETNLTDSFQDLGLLTNSELYTIITNTSKSKYILSKLPWVISGYELVDYQYNPQFFQDNAYPKYMTIVPKGFKVTLDLDQLDYPEYYALLINTGITTDSYQINDFLSKIHFPKPDLYLVDQTIEVNPGFNLLMIPFNSTDYFDLNVKVDIDKKDIPENIKINFPSRNTFTIFDGVGELPLEVTINSKSNISNILLPLNISYTVIGDNDFIDAEHNNSLTTEYNYSKNIILDLDVKQQEIQLINWSEIPPQYIAIFIGAIFSFFIPSMARLVKEYTQKRTADNLLKHLMSEKQKLEIKDNEDLQISINRLSSMHRLIRQKFVKGNISKDQYEIIKENLHEILKDLVSKTEK
jgi:hypothetical protein